MFTENELPSIRKIPAESFRAGFRPARGFRALEATPNELAGGFGCVVQVSAAHSFELFKDATPSPGIAYRVRGRRLRQFTQDTGHQFNSFVLGRPVVLGDNVDYLFNLTLTPTHFELEAPRRVRVTFQGNLSLTDDPNAYTASTLLGPVGTVELTLRVDYRAVTTAQTKQAEVRADMARANFEWQYGSAKVRAVFQTFLAADGTRIQNSLSAAGDVHLIPRISLVGRNPGNVEVTEINRFDVTATHVGAVVNGSPVKALAVGFDLEAGLQGASADVEHFIGDGDYGVISSQYLVDKVLKHKWRLNGFARSFPLKRSIVIHRDGQPEDATLEGTLTLDTLEFVRVECDSSTRTDFIGIGGLATSRAQQIRLADGKVLGPTDLNTEKIKVETDFMFPWGLVTGLGIQPSPAQDPAIEAIQQQAHLDGYQHLTRPFAHPTAGGGGIQIEYTLVAGVTHHILIVGRFVGRWV